MAFKSIKHDDEKIFYNRLWKLMEERNCLAYLQLKVKIQMLLDSVKQQGYLKNRSEG